MFPLTCSHRATFKKDFGRKYATAAEDTARRATFAANLQRIVALNAAPGAAAYGDRNPNCNRGAERAAVCRPPS